MEQINKYGCLWGKWIPVERIGKGAFGSVYRIQENMGKLKDRAVKVIRVQNHELEICSNETCTSDMLQEQKKKLIEAAERYIREIELMNKLDAVTNIVTIHDYDIKPGTLTTEILLMMELLTSLSSRMKETTFDRKEVIRLGIDICKALEACEKAEIIHRDIKPDNIFIDDQGHYKLGDFGLSRTTYGNSASASFKGRNGTPLYMAPEAISMFESVDYKTDQYALGIVLYQLLNKGCIPFCEDMNDLDELKEALRRKLEVKEELPPPADDNGELWQVVRKACSLDMADRYNNASEMKQALLQIYEKEKAMEQIPTSLLLKQKSLEWDTVIEKAEGSVGKKEGHGRVFALVLAGVLTVCGCGAGYYYNATSVVPDVSHMTQENAKTYLEASSFTVKQIQPIDSDDVAINCAVYVDSQNERIKKGSSLVLYISKGHKTVLENMQGKSYEALTAELDTMKAHGIQISVEEAYSEDVKLGAIIAQSVSEGSVLYEGDTLELTVSKGRKEFKVGTYAKKDSQNVIETLKKAGIKVKKKEEYSFDVKKGYVISQSVKKGAILYKGDTIELTISKGVEKTTVPSLTGFTQAAAQSKLSQAGLTLGNVTKVYDSAPSGQVISQTVNSGTTVNKKTSVSITVSIGPKPVQTYKPTYQSSDSSSSGSSSPSRPSIDSGQTEVVN